MVKACCCHSKSGLEAACFFHCTLLIQMTPLANYLHLIEKDKDGKLQNMTNLLGVALS